MKIKTLKGSHINVRQLGGRDMLDLLSEKAFNLCSNSDPCDIYEREIIRETDDGEEEVELRYYIRGLVDRDDMTAEELNAMLEDVADDGAETELEYREADAGMRYQSWLALIESAREIPDGQQLLAEIGGPTWIGAYTADECVRICKAAVSVAGDGIRGLLAFLGTSQAAFADRYLIPRRSVENWCTRSEINHRDCPAYVVSLLSYAALRDAGII